MARTVEQVREWTDTIPVDDTIGPFSHIYPAGPVGPGAVAYCGHVKKDAWSGHSIYDHPRKPRYCAVCRRICEASGWFVP